MIKFDDYLMEQLRDVKESQAYINIAFEEYSKDQNKELLIAGLNNAIKAIQK